MKQLCRAVFLSAIALISIQRTTLFAPSVCAGAVPAAASPAKKGNKFKKRKQKILKGRRGKHSRRPARFPRIRQQDGLIHHAEPRKIILASANTD